MYGMRTQIFGLVYGSLLQLYGNQSQRCARFTLEFNPVTWVKVVQVTSAHIGHN